MTDEFLCLMIVMLFGFIIVLPVYVNVFKENIYLYIKERMNMDKKGEKLKKQIYNKK